MNLLKEFKSRRSELLRKVGGNSVVIISAAKKCTCGGDHPYRQDSDFYYLTGCVEPDLIAVLVPGRDEGEFVLFCHESDSAKEIWHGATVNQEVAQNELGADQAFSISDIDDILPQMLVGLDDIYFNLDFDQDFVKRVIFWLKQARAKISNAELPYKLINLGDISHEMRLNKSQSELVAIRKAVAITVQGHLRAMQKCRPGMNEFELEAELLYEFGRLGGRRNAFRPIVAGGVNACTLHYSKNDQELSRRQLVLVDAGVEYEGYCADISRTFPVDGVFTPEQRAVYGVVLEAQLAVISHIRPGVEWGVLQSVVEIAITKGLVAIGLLKGKIEELLAKQEFKPFFMHRVGHWLGLDVHDVGSYQVAGKGRVLEEGMVFTVEPGIYIRPDIANIESRWVGIGVRIEDDVLVTADGCEVLTAELPKGIAEIERIMEK